MSIVLIAITASAALLLLCLFVWRVEAGLACLFAAELINLAFGLNGAVLGRLHLNALDAVSMALLAAGFIRFGRNLDTLSFPHMAAAGYLIIFAVSFARGWDANGLFAAANESRGFVGPLAALLYFTDAGGDEASLRRIVRLYLWFGGSLCMLAGLAAAGLPVGVAALGAADDRVLPSNAAAILAICGFLALARVTYFGRRMLELLWPPVFFFTAIYLRHRTVWMMLLVGCLATVLVDRRLFQRTVLVALASLAAVTGLAIFGSAIGHTASESDFAHSLSDGGTWQWRIDGWQQFLFDADQTPLTILAGKPLGDGWLRIDPKSHLLQSAPPHSEYVTEYLRVGVSGLVLLILFAFRPLAALWRTPEGNTTIHPCACVWAVVVLMVLVYGIAYSIEPDAYALLGIASSIATRARAHESLLDVTHYRIEESSPGLAG